MMTVFKRITALLLGLVMAVSLVPAADAFGREPVAPESVDRCCNTLRAEVYEPDYFRPDYEGKLIDITPQRVADTFAYLDEHYVRNHPEQALDVYTGTADDRENLRKLAQIITEGCATDTEKADAIGKWLSGNITYDVNTSAYASDTFFRREGNCLSYANLMMFLLRSLGIPAVVGDGWRGNMKTMGAELFDMEGHAWIFVLLEGQWVLYDPLWIEGGTTDRTYMAEWIYFDQVEFITPASDENNLPPVSRDKTVAYYTDGRYYLHSNGLGNTMGTLSLFVNNQAYIYVSNQCEVGGSQDGWYYLDEGHDKTTMDRGELYRDSWVSYGNYKKGNAMLLSYAFPNGMMPDGYTAEYDGKLWYMSYDSALPILADEDDYWIEEGVVTLRPGYVGRALGVCWQDGAVNPDDEDRYLVYRSENPDVATIDDNGVITCHAEGYARFEVRLMRRETYGETLMGNNYIYIMVKSEKPVPDFRDMSSHEHDLQLQSSTPADCQNWGMEIWKCSGCSYTEERCAVPPLEHDYQYTHSTEPTCTDYGLNFYACIHCGETYCAAEIDVLGHDYVRTTFTEPTCTEMGVSCYACSRCDEEYLLEDLDALGHEWNGTGCTRCDATRPHAFTDVQEDAFYEDPVIWAVEKGITNGISATEFGAGNICNRAQVVTFLWRAAGQPEPTSMENPFTDVASGSFYEKAVLWAVEKGVTNGTSATTFGPNDPCNRAAVVTFLWRAAGQPEPANTVHGFADVAKASFYEKAVLWAVENGVTNGISATEFGPTTSCNRAQVVTFLYRAFAE